MELKYKKEIQNFDCNLSKFKEIEQETFRWTFEDKVMLEILNLSILTTQSGSKKVV